MSELAPKAIEEMKVELKETCELADAVIALVDFGFSNLANGFQPLEDGFAALRLAGPLKLGLEDAEQVMGELQKADSETRKTFNLYFAQKYDIPDDRIEKYSEYAVALVVAAIGLAGEKKLLAAS